MDQSPTQRLAALGIVLPKPPAPVANYVPTLRSGGWLFVSGQLPLEPDGALALRGKVGAGLDLAMARAATKMCAINVLAQVAEALGSLDHVRRVVRLGGFINCAPDFADLSAAMNGASNLMVAVFGDAGIHVRTTVGVSQLPMNAAAEVEAMLEIAA